MLFPEKCIERGWLKMSGLSVFKPGASHPVTAATNWAVLGPGLFPYVEEQPRPPPLRVVIDSEDLS
jgi:hypothetical protein